MAKRRSKAHTSERLILDSGAVIAAARGDTRVRASIQRSVELNAPIVVPVVVLAETLRGGHSDARTQIALKCGDTDPTSPAVGVLAGSIQGRASGDDTVDALIVAETILAGGGMILTEDPDDLRVLASGHPTVEVRSIARL
jgi:predicted nucleic acid-binding protein